MIASSLEASEMFCDETNEHDAVDRLIWRGDMETRLRQRECLPQCSMSKKAMKKGLEPLVNGRWEARWMGFHKGSFEGNVECNAITYARMRQG